MELRDLIVTPLVVLAVYMIAYFIRPYATDENTRPYFFYALTFKIIGAISLGILYQFYYNGGDTYYYHTYGSRLLWEVFFESPADGIDLLFKNAGDYTDGYRYASRIYFFRDSASFAVIRIASVFDLFTYSTYSATATLFAVFSFSGIWLLYLTFYKQYPLLHRNLALAICFIPSCIFWGSGVLKDSIVLGCIGIATYHFHKLFFEKRISVTSVLALLLTLYTIFIIRKFVLQAYIPASIIWILSKNLGHIRSMALRIMMAPFILGIIFFSTYYTIVKVGEGDEKYSIAKLGETARITSFDIRYLTGREAGSGYDLGELDGSFGSMLRLAPQAINVSLFRPYLWEVKNLLMLLSSLEGLLFLMATIYIITKNKFSVINSLADPNIIFCLVFSITFAFAVGVSTFNFGTLARYKIPLLPFFATSLVLIANYCRNSERKLEEFDTTE